MARRDRVLRAAYGLLGDGQGCKWDDDDNQEYTRGIVELVSDLLGFGSDDDDFVFVRLLIRRRGNGERT